jgi:hypothetical protein
VEQQYYKLGAVLSSPCVAFHMCIATNCSWSLVYCVIILEFIFFTSYVLFYYVFTAVLHNLVAGLLARSQYPEGPVTGHLGIGFS